MIILLIYSYTIKAGNEAFYRIFGRKATGKMRKPEICRILSRKLHKQFIFTVYLLKNHLPFYEQ